MPDLPDPSLAWDDLSAKDRRALTEMLVDKIIIERHPAKTWVEEGKRRRSYLIRAIRTKILSKKLSASRRCTRPGSRSSREPDEAETC